ncbi:MAG: V-type ATP synthase subunit F [Oscillospiraceae bacterium]
MAEKVKIAVVGDRDSVMLWGALGFETAFVSDAAEAAAAVHRLAREGAAVIFMTEPSMQLALEAVDRYRTQAFPAIIPIPNRDGSLGLGMRGITANIERAIGADILFEGEGK